MGWFKDRWRREGAGRPAPESGWRRVGVMGLTHFWKLIRVNLLFVLFSLPVLTLPAALTALDRVCVVIYKEGNIFLWDEFWKEFRRSFARTILPGLGFGLLLFGGYFFMSLGNGNAALGFPALIFWAIGILMACTALILGEYFFVLVAVLDINNFGALKNALILWLARPGSGLLALVIVLLLFFFSLAMLPVITPALLLFLLPVLCQYPICYLVFDVTEDLVLIPYEERKARKKQENNTDSMEDAQ